MSDITIARGKKVNLQELGQNDGWMIYLEDRDGTLHLISFLNFVEKFRDRRLYLRHFKALLKETIYFHGLEHGINILSQERSCLFFRNENEGLLINYDEFVSRHNFPDLFHEIKGEFQEEQKKLEHSAIQEALKICDQIIV